MITPFRWVSEWVRARPPAPRVSILYCQIYDVTFGVFFDMLANSLLVQRVALWVNWYIP